MLHPFLYARLHKPSSSPSSQVASGHSSISSSGFLCTCKSNTEYRTPRSLQSAREAYSLAAWSHLVPPAIRRRVTHSTLVQPANLSPGTKLTPTYFQTGNPYETRNHSICGSSGLFQHRPRYNACSRVSFPANQLTSYTNYTHPTFPLQTTFRYRHLHTHTNTPVAHLLSLSKYIQSYLSQPTHPDLVYQPASFSFPHP